MKKLLIIFIVAVFTLGFVKTSYADEPYEKLPSGSGVQYRTEASAVCSDEKTVTSKLDNRKIDDCNKYDDPDGNPVVCANDNGVVGCYIKKSAAAPGGDDQGGAVSAAGGNIVASCGPFNISVYYGNDGKDAPWKFWRQKEVCRWPAKPLPGQVCKEFTNSDGDQDAGCFAGGEQPQPAPEEGPPAPTCTNDTDCTDGNACTEDKCEDGKCVNANKPAGEVCQRDGTTFQAIKYCNDSGKCELDEPSAKTCTNDINCVDGNACTEDKCEEGKCVNSNKPAGSACENDPITFQPIKYCSGAGKCEVKKPADKPAAPAPAPDVEQPPVVVPPGRPPAAGTPQAPTIPESELAKCEDNPSTLKPGERPNGYSWEANCSKSCTKNADCPQNTSDGYVNPETSNWCYGFVGGSRCLMLKREVAAAATPAPAGVGTTTPGQSTVTPSPSPSPAAIFTTKYRYAENPTSLHEWLPYTAGGVIISHRFANTTLEAKFIYAEFLDNRMNITRAKPYPFEIRLVDYATIGASPAPVGAQLPVVSPTPTPRPEAPVPAGSECSAYETTSVCGRNDTNTYDKCTDDKGQTGSQLCSGGAVQFYCEGSTNSNCISSTTRTPHYYCSACPNLRGR